MVIKEAFFIYLVIYLFNGTQLEEIINIVEKRNIRPKIDTRIFNISQVNEALTLVATGRTYGKVIISI